MPAAGSASWSWAAVDDALTSALLRLADGDRSAFDEVYAAASPRVDALCARLLGAGPDAEDAAQQALIRVFARVGEYRSDVGPALPWILGIAAWEARTARQRSRRRREEALPEAPLASQGLDPEHQLLDAALEEALDDVIGTLRPIDREAVLAALGRMKRPRVTAAAFRKRLERALERLRDAWRKAHG